MVWLIFVVFSLGSSGVAVDHIPMSSMVQCELIAAQLQTKKPWWIGVENYQTYCVKDTKSNDPNPVKYT